MNKTELTAAVAQKAGLSKSDAAKVLGAFFETVSEELSKGQAVQIIGFGNFEVADYKARTGRNPQTGAVLEIPAGKRPKFTAGSALKKHAPASEKQGVCFFYPACEKDCVIPFIRDAWKPKILYKS